MKTLLKKTLLIFLMIGILSNNVYGQDKAVVLQQGEQAPFTGVLFTREHANQIRYELLEKDTLASLNTSLQRSNELLRSGNEIAEQRIQKLNELNLNLNERALKQDDNRNFTLFTGVAVGVLLTVLSGWAIGQVSK